MSTTALSFAITAIDQASQVFEQVGQAAGDTEEKAKAGASSMADNLTKASAVIVTGGVAAAGGLFAIGSTFDDVSDTIAIGTGKSGAALDSLVDVAKKVGHDVPSSFEDIAPVVAQVDRALGLTGDSLVQVSSQFAQLSNMMGQPADIDAATGALNAFQVEGSDVSSALDDLWSIAQQTGQNFNTLAQQTKAAGPVMQELGFGFNTTAQLIGELNKNGIDSGPVLAGMKKSLIEMAKAGEAPEETFKRVTAQVQEFTAQGDTNEAINLAGRLFGTKGAVQFVEAVKSGALSVDSLTAQVDRSGGSILEQAENTADFAEQWQLFKNRALLELEPVATRVFGLVGNFMTWINDSAVPFLIKYKDIFIPLAYVIGGVAGAIVIATAAVKAWEFATRIWTTVQTIANGVQWAWNAALAASPVVLITLAVIALIAIIVLIATKTTWFQDIWSAAWSAISGAISTVWNWISDNWPLLLAVLTGPIGAAVLLIKGHWDDIKAGFGAVADWIGDKVGWIGDKVSWAIDAVKKFFGALPYGAGLAFNAVADIWNNTVGKLSFGIPSWVPVIGGNKWDVPDIPKRELSIPAFERGGIVRVGDNRSGIEAIIPLERAAEMGFGRGSDGGDTYHIEVHGFIGNYDELVRAIEDAKAKAKRRGMQFAPA